MAADERRCPRCGTAMQEDRRGPERRMTIRRENPANDPGPPPASVDGDAPSAASAGKKKPKGAAAGNPERRIADRRSGRRRGGRSNLPPAAGGDSAGWQD